MARGKNRDDFDDVDVELGISREQGNPQSNNNNFSTFFDEVATMKAEIASANVNVEKLSALYKDNCSEANPDRANKQRVNIDKLVQKINGSITRIKDMLEGLSAEIRKLEQADPGSSELRIKQNQHAQLTRSLVATMTTFNDVQEASKQAYKNNIKRHLTIVKDGHEPSDREVDDAILRGTDAVFLQAMQQPSAALKTARTVYDEIQETHRDILNIEQSLTELNQMFVDMAMLIDTQQELLDNIAVNVGNSVEYVEKGRVYLKEAKQYQQKGRKLNCCILLIVVGVLLAVLIIGGVMGGIFGAGIIKV